MRWVKKFALLSRETNALTINDLFFYRYKNKYLVWLSSLALLLAFFAAMNVQFIGGARLLETTIGISYTQALLLFALTVGIYTFIGGFRAVVLTDTIQGTVMIFWNYNSPCWHDLCPRWCRKCGQ